MTTIHLLVGFMYFGALIGESLVQGAEPSILSLIIETNKVSVCFNNEGTALDNSYTYYLLDIEFAGADIIDVKPISLKQPDADALSKDIICLECTEAKCIDSKDIADLMGKPKIDLVLHIEKDGEDGGIDPFIVTGVTAMPLILPVAPIGMNKNIYVIGDTSSKIIKVPDGIIATDNTLFLNGKDVVVSSCTDYPCYISKKVEPVNVDADVVFMVCYQKTTDDIPVCGKQKNGIVIQNLVDPPTIAITVDYDASVSFALDGANIDVLLTSPTVKNCLPTCPLPGLNSQYDVMLVDYDKKTLQNDIVKDRSLDAYDLGEGKGVVEVKWAKNNVDYFYMFRKTTTNPDAGGSDEAYHKANVDCSATNGDNCHAYFTGLPVGDHVITIQEITDDVWLLTKVPEKDLWKKTDDTTFKSHLQQLPDINEDFRVIHAEHITTTVIEDMILLDVCFEYIPDIIRNNTQYEFLAVNTKGKWKKENGDKKKDDLHACFHGIQLPLADFSESSKFFVILRDSDNGKPLASGEVTFDLPAVRAIKPEVDNGNNGSTSTLAIVGAAIVGIACLMALVAAAVMFVMKINRNNDGLQYPLQHNNIEDASTIHGLDNSIPTM